MRFSKLSFLDENLSKRSFKQFYRRRKLFFFYYLKNFQVFVEHFFIFLVPLEGRVLDEDVILLSLENGFATKEILSKLVVDVSDKIQ